MNSRDNLTTTNQPIGKLYIRRRTNTEILTWVIALWPFLVRLLTDVMPLPGAIKYVADGLLVFALVLVFAQRRLVVKKQVLPCLKLIVFFFAYTLLGNVLNFQSPFYYLWGLRNNFRFYVAFFLYITLVNEYDANRWLKLLDILFWLNAIVTIVQFFGFGVFGDNLGGILGVTGGSNGYTLIFFIIVISKSLLSAFDGQENGALCAAKCGVSIFVAAMAEMKFYFVVFVVIMVAAAVLTKFSAKKCLMFVACGIALVGGASLLTSWFRSEGIFSFQSLWELATKANYASQTDINRLSAIPTLSKMFLPGLHNKLVGLGLGNCDTSAYAICNTPFAVTYEYLHYNWFSAPMMFIETGYIGLLMYFGFFGIVLRVAVRQKKAGKGNMLLNQLAIIVAAMCMVLSFYNSSMRIEAAYMAYFVLAMPFLV